ncbi:MAG: Integrase, catalytic region [Fibrobacteres bacterium]|nr:Integrase, catalytic region [Fibrobacterota bacterium]
MDIAAALALTGDGFSRRKIARMLGVSRNTLRKYLTAGTVAGVGHDPGKLASYLIPLSEMLGENPDARSIEIFRALKAKGYSGSYDLVKRKVRSLRLGIERGDSAPAPGARATADLGRVDLAGHTMWLFTLCLDFSGRIYAELSDRADLDAFLEWHIRAFRYFQGVPAEIAYERSRNRHLKALVGRAGVNLPMARFAGHHGFVPVPARAFSPWAIGRLKRPLRMIEVLFLRGYPFKTLEGANTALLGWLLGREESPGREMVKDKFSREQPFLMPLPKMAFARVPLKLQKKP